MMTDRQPIRLTDAAPFRLGAIVVTPAARTLAARGRESVLEPRVMQVLVTLHRGGGEVVGRGALVDACWEGRVVGEDAINRSILKLRRALDEIGANVTVETVAKVGYRLRLPTPAAMPVREQPAQRMASRRWLVGAGVAAVVAIGTAGALLERRGHDGPPSRIVAVEALRVPAADPPAHRLAQDFASDLSRAVLGHDDRLEFADGQGATNSGAAFTVSGSVASIDTDLQAVVMVKRRDEPTILWSHDYAAPLAQADGLRQQVGINVAAVLVCALGTEGVPEQMDVETTALYLETCTLHAGDHRRELSLLRQVTTRAPLFAGGWADLAISLAFNIDGETDGGAPAMRREAEAAATRALSLDPHLGRAYFARALLLPGIPNWMARRRIITAGLAAQPDCPQLYNAQARDLADIGRSRDSIDSNRRAVALDPLFPGKPATLARALANAGRLDEANAVVRHMEQAWPDSSYTWHAKFETAARIGDPREADKMLDNPRDPAFDRRGITGWRTFLHARETPTAANVRTAIDTLLADRARGAASDAQLVSDFALLGRPQLALAIALRMPPQPNGDFWFRAVLRPIRADPRFLLVARQQGLYPIWRATGLWPDFCRDEALRYDCRTPPQAVAAAAPRPVRS